MGFGIQGTRLREPGKQKTEFEQFSVEYVVANDSWIQSDGSKTVFVTSAVVNNIVKSSLEQSFGSVDSYKNFLKSALGVGSPQGESIDLRQNMIYRGDYIDATVVPLGEILSNSAKDARPGNCILLLSLLRQWSESSYSLALTR